MMGLTFTPALPLWLFGALVICGVVVVGVGIHAGARSTLWRGLALGVLILALARPSLVEEQKTRLDDVVAVVVDQSASQTIGNRQTQTELAAQALKAKLERQSGLDVRMEYVPPGDPDKGTRLFTALKQALADVPRQRLAGVYLVTDGQVHDVPDLAEAKALSAPVHALITGDKTEFDRRLVVETLPKYGMVGKTVEVSFKVEQTNATSPDVPQVSIRHNGVELFSITSPLGHTQTVDIPIEHAGTNVVEIEVTALDGEISTGNNRAAAVFQGIRDRLKVLLVSGQPHAGERTWRNLLKADAAVDLVHFTILRPIDKTDATPLNELALIAFPIQELFQKKLHEFDLIVFDRYTRRGMLPNQYLENILGYIRTGGAVMFAVGPEYGDIYTLYNSPLREVLPAVPTAKTFNTAYRPTLTDKGKRHPVTNGLGRASEWGPWLRQIDGQVTSGEVLMTGHNDQPLLILDRAEEGRVALLLSDTIWLWAKGYEGGGPQAELLRRLAHWLMKEPELEEEALRAVISGGSLTVTRQSLTPTTSTVTVTTPVGEDRALELTVPPTGPATGTLPLEGSGLYRVTDGKETTLAVAGSINPLETSDMAATPARLTPFVGATGGGVYHLSESGVPDPRRTKPGKSMAGNSWAGFRDTQSVLITGLSEVQLLSNVLVLLLVMAGILTAWVREGR